jgi:hypothetical protein
MPDSSSRRDLNARHTVAEQSGGQQGCRSRCFLFRGAISSTGPNSEIRCAFGRIGKHHATARYLPDRRTRCRQSGGPDFHQLEPTEEWLHSLDALRRAP